MRTINESESSTNNNKEHEMEAGETPPEKAPSDISSKTTFSQYVKCSWLVVAFVTLLIVAIGFGVGWGFAQSNNNDIPTQNDSIKTPDDGNTTDPEPEWIDSEDYFLFGGVETASTTEANDRNECLEFCAEYDALQYLFVLNACTCYSSVTCLMPWGSQVDSDNYHFLGDLYTKSKLEVCPEEYCQVYGNSSGLCFTANARDYQDYSLFGGEMKEISSTKVNDMEACLDDCSPYDAASFLNWQDCKCYDQVECWLDWGNPVDTQYLFGMVYSKKSLEGCSQQYCDLIEDGRCFTANSKDYKKYTLYGVDMVERNSTKTSSQDECLDFCAAYDAASFHRPNSCTCYDKPDCWLSWGDGDQVDTELFFGNVWSKEPLDICESKYCDVYNDGLCFTANSQNYRQYSLYADAMVEMASNKTSGKEACLALCAPYDAATFLNFEDCTCFNTVQCFMPWGDRVDTQNFFGTVFSKRPLDICTQDYCETNADGLCFTANYQAYREYSLFGNNLTETASSNGTSNKEECLDFCAPSNAAQYLNFQDPSCTCYDQPECWLPWSENQTDTSGGSFSGFVYSRTELSFCTFDYCNQFPDTDQCVENNDQS
jgi:hypothetical protein